MTAPNSVESSEKEQEAGKLTDFMVFEGDIVSPLGEGMWDASQEKSHI